MEIGIMDAFQNNVLSKPEVFFQECKETYDATVLMTKDLFNRLKAAESQESQKTRGRCLQLYVDGFDCEQIWEQIQIQNVPFNKSVKSQMDNLMGKPEQCFLKLSHSMENESDDASMTESHAKSDLAEDSYEDEDDEEEEEDAQGDEDEKNVSCEEPDQDDSDIVTEKRKETKNQNQVKEKKGDGIEDGMFSWEDMERHTEELEQENSENDSDSEEDEDDLELDMDAGGDIKHEDFFGPRDQTMDDDLRGGDKERHFDEESEDDGGEGHTDVDVDEEEEAERGILSTFQKAQIKMKEQVKQLEAEAMEKKSWELKGEVKSSARPENSLLEATLEYDRPTKVAPTITPEVTESLENIIKQRILDGEWNDVVRKLAVNEKAEKEQEELSQEKSKEGLGDIYEKEYMKNAMGFEQDDAMKKDQDEIQTMFDRLSWQLNALFNFHFTPKPPVKEVSIKAAVPAIAMEEIVPMGVQDANLKAPEEIYAKKHGRDGVVRSVEEMTTEEKRSQRQAKKSARRKQRKQKDADERLVSKINPGLGNKYSKEKMLESLRAKNVTEGDDLKQTNTRFTKSSEFFAKLQDDVSRNIKEKSEIAKKGKDSQSSGKSSAAYKL